MTDRVRDRGLLGERQRWAEGLLEEKRKREKEREPDRVTDRDKGLLEERQKDTTDRGFVRRDRQSDTQRSVL